VNPAPLTLTQHPDEADSRKAGAITNRHSCLYGKQRGGVNPPSRQKTQDPKPPEDLARARGFRLIAGVDEAGRGPWAGPVVAAAVVIPARLASLGVGGTHRLVGVRIDDSKRLTVRQRHQAYHAIIQHALTGIGIVPPDVIDTDNILNATLQAMARAIADLACQPELVLVDGPRAPKLPVPCWTIVNGDRLSYPVACASIVAKVTRDWLMVFYHRLFPAYRFDRHKGYGTTLHQARLARVGPSCLHRMSFHPVSEVLPQPSPLTAHQHEPTGEVLVTVP